MKIDVKNVSFAYDIRKVVEDVSIDFKPGCFYSILGPNGCGKTTFLDLLIGHLIPDSGNIFLGDKRLFSRSRREISREIALVSQSYDIHFPFTVKEIVMMGRHPYIPRFAQPGKKDLQIVKKVMENTGTEELASRKITDLSGGERQRCVFARALCQNTPFLFLDEAFSNMDINHTLHLLTLIKKEVRQNNRTVISVFHDINLASAWSDELIFMKEGRIRAWGCSENIMDESIIEKVFHVKSTVVYNPYLCAKQANFRVEH